MAALKDVFNYYWEYTKPLYCEIEARDNALPVELLFEIHAAFDHLARHTTCGEDLDDCVNKALSHLKRGCLDAFKLKHRNFKDDVDLFLKNKVDFSYLDNGRFLSSLMKDRRHIDDLVVKARLAESKSDTTDAFKYWTEVSLAIDSFCDRYLKDGEKLIWAKNKTFALVGKESIISFITGVLSSSLIWWLTS
ncbi:MAG: hypothetical protein AB7E52_05180 [Bdellovibrionales bacterium]